MTLDQIAARLRLLERATKGIDYVNARDAEDAAQDAAEEAAAKEAAAKSSDETHASE